MTQQTTTTQPATIFTPETYAALQSIAAEALEAADPYTHYGPRYARLVDEASDDTRRRVIDYSPDPAETYGLTPPNFWRITTEAAARIVAALILHTRSKETGSYSTVQERTDHTARLVELAARRAAATAPAPVAA